MSANVLVLLRIVILVGVISRLSWNAETLKQNPSVHETKSVTCCEIVAPLFDVNWPSVISCLTRVPQVGRLRPLSPSHHLDSSLHHLTTRLLHVVGPGPSSLSPWPVFRVEDWTLYSKACRSYWWNAVSLKKIAIPFVCPLPRVRGQKMAPQTCSPFWKLPHHVKFSTEMSALTWSRESWEHAKVEPATPLTCTHFSPS